MYDISSCRNGGNMKIKKYGKTSAVLLVFVVLGLAYYFYLSNKTPRTDSTDKAVTDTEMAALTTRDIENNYPESPRGVVELYARITKAYYKKGATDEQLEALGKQARLLFDNELKSKQTEEEFIKDLKVDVAVFNSMGKYVSDFQIDSASNFEYKTIDNKDYSIGMTLYYVRQGSKLSKSYQSYKLRKDEQGRWKILYWELVNSDLEKKLQK